MTMNSALPRITALSRTLSPTLSNQGVIGLPSRRLRILDTTLRDGDQAAGYAFTPAQKLSIALALEEAGVDCVEAGFPASSAREADICRLIAASLRTASVAVMSRASVADIRSSAAALDGSGRGVLHLSLPVSRLHIETKLRKTEAEILSLAAESTLFAAGLASAVEAGAEDATRADRSFLLEYCCAVTEAGAGIVNIADTVGHTVPHEFAGLIRFLLERVPAFRNGQSLLSVHCHNDFGLANANTLSGITAGCGQIEVTCLGLGERSGNAALEEIGAVLRCRSDLYRVDTGLNAPATDNLVSLVSGIIGSSLSPFKPVTGWNRRSHASGIHQQGILTNAQTYAPGPDDPADRIVIGPHSGRAGLRDAVRRYAGREIGEADLTRLLETVKTDQRAIPSLGVTELLSMLYDDGLIDNSPIGCDSLVVSERLTPAGFMYIATAGFAAYHPKGAAVDALSTGMTATSDTWTEAIVGLVRSVSPAVMALETISFSGYRQAYPSPHSPSNPAMRLNLAVTASDPAGNPGRRYVLERVGFSQYRLLLDCLLDMVNAEKGLASAISPSV